jgi:hypothetical protein
MNIRWINGQHLRSIPKTEIESLVGIDLHVYIYTFIQIYIYTYIYEYMFMYVF